MATSCSNGSWQRTSATGRPATLDATSDSTCTAPLTRTPPRSRSADPTRGSAHCTSTTRACSAAGRLTLSDSCAVSLFSALVRAEHTAAVSVSTGSSPDISVTASTGERLLTRTDTVTVSWNTMCPLS